MTWSAVRSQRPQAPDAGPGNPQRGILQAARKPKAPVAEFPALSPAEAALMVDVNKSMKARRDLAWKIVKRLWEPVHVQGGQIPTWMTWYEQEDIEELYKEMLSKQSKPSTRAEEVANASALLRQHSVKDLQV